MSFPKRKCAISGCELDIRVKQRLCEGHQIEYGDRTSEPWLEAMIEYSNYEYNQAVKSYRRRECPLSWVEGTKGV